MLLSVSHDTRYAYDRPVFLEPTIIRLRPMATLAQTPRAFSLRVEPEPAGSATFEDPNGNIVTRAWFTGTTEQLIVRSTFEVQTLRPNPFDFVLVDPASAAVPMVYPHEDLPALARFRSPSGAVDGFAADVAAAANHDVLTFLDELTKRLHTFAYEIREEGDPWPPERTLAAASGSCRDLTVLFVDACRSVGLAARFVSGYQRAGEEQGKRYMHAWPEVYLSGAGWRGYDPSLGLAVADGHVAVATGAVSAEAAPTTGSFRGTGATATMTADITIEESA